MQIDLTKVLQCEGNTLEVEANIPLDALSYNGQAFQFVEPVKLTGKITNVGPILEMNVEACFKFLTNCVRCLKEINCQETFLISEKLVRDENHTTYDDVYIFHGYFLDLSDIALKNFLLNTSLKYLCSDDCKGICPICGTDLNVKTCTCGSDEIDPRLAVLKSFKTDK